jgi:hypothetical protein
VRGWRTAAVVLLLALASLAAWRVEVEWVKGWAGLRWLEGYPWAALPICLFVAAAVLVPVAARRSVPAGRAFAFLILATGTCLLAFELARRWLYEAGSARLPPAPSVWRLLLSPLTSIALAAAGLFLAVDRLLLHLPARRAAFFVGALLLIWPASLLTIQLLPVHGYRDAIHAVKGGYPTFWTTLLLGAVAAAAVRPAAGGETRRS